MLFCPHLHPIIVVAKFNPKSYCWICCMEFVKTILVSSRITAVKMRTGGFHCLWLLKGPWRGYLGDRLKIILNSIPVCYLLKINANDNHLTGGHHHHLPQKPEELPFPALPLLKPPESKWLHFPNVYFVLINSISAAFIFRQNQ